jgi:hypothetical protein
VKRTTFLTAFVSLLAICLSSCGSDSLRTIELSASGSNSGGFFDLKGEGGTIQLTATGHYAYGPSRDMSNRVTFTITVDAPNGIPGTDIYGQPLPTPPYTVMVSKTGLLTAVDPWVCTYVDVGTASQAAWALTGSYKIVASFGGITSQPVYVGVASQAGPGGPPANGACGP